MLSQLNRRALKGCSGVRRKRRFGHRCRQRRGRCGGGFFARLHVICDHRRARRLFGRGRFVLRKLGLVAQGAGLKDLRELDRLFRRQRAFSQQPQQFGAQVGLHDFRLGRIEDVVETRRDADHRRRHRQQRHDANAPHETTALGGDRPAVDVAAFEFGAQRFFQQLHLCCFRAAVPAGEILRLKRAKSERNVHAVEQNWDQAALIARQARFIAHEGRGGGGFGPDHDHRLGRAQLALDHGGVVLAGPQGAIPPDRKAARLQGLGQWPHAISIFARIGDEDVGHVEAPVVSAPELAYRNEFGGSARRPGVPRLS